MTLDNKIDRNTKQLRAGINNVAEEVKILREIFSTVWYIKAIVSISISILLGVVLCVVTFLNKF